MVDWLKANKELSPEDQASRHGTLETSAKKIVGEVASIDILNCWLQSATAELLSNPQLPEAIDTVLAAQDQRNEEK